MEYFNKNTSEYRTALKNNLITRYLLRLELLSYYENPIGEITKDISLEAQGQININYKQLTRRSCSLTLANIEDKYLPSPNSPIWYLRKFKLWLGIEDNYENIWWFSQGVYCIVSATANAHTVQIEAVDKGGTLDGTLKLNLAEVQYVVESGATITDIVRDTLALNIGGNVAMTNSNAYGGANMPIDPVQPLVDLRYNNQKIKADISVDANNYIGNLFVSIADGYGADIYYDGDGHFRFNALADVFFVDGYKYMAAQWEYDNLSDANCQYNFDGLNAVTVYTNLSISTEALIQAQEESKQDDEDESVSIEPIDPEDVQAYNLSYTAYNVNPLSPIRVGAVGVRRMESQEIDYIDTTDSDMLARCQQYAVMLLHKQTMLGATLNFNSPIIPHIDVNKTIRITDEYLNIHNELFVVQSVTIPLGAGAMQISATNINWLPSGVNVEGMGMG